MGWYVTAGLALASGLYSAQEERRAGQIERREAAAQAAEIRRQKNDIALIANEQNTDRMAALNELLQFNQALAAKRGITGRSLAAITRREQRKAGTDIDRIAQQQARETAAIERQAVATERRGVEAARAARVRSRATLFDTAYNLSTLRGE